MSLSMDPTPPTPPASAPHRSRSARFFIGHSLLGLGKAILILSLSTALSVTFVAGFVLLHYYHELPRDLSVISDYTPSSLTQVFSADEELIGEFYLERRIVVPLDRIPPTVVNAFLAAEDARFFRHKGIDPKGIARAFLNNLRAGRVVQGGSTITQQVVKNLLLTPERSLSRKIQEALLSYRIENELSKEDILQIYLNMVYLGHGAYGVEAASRVYFGRSVSDLTLGEAAMLAGLVKAPGRSSPYLHFDRARKRQKYVLGQMLKAGFISRSEASFALDEPLEILALPEVNHRAAPYFVQHIRRLVQDRFGRNQLYRRGLRIYTTLRMDWQRQVRGALRAGLEAHADRQGFLGPDTILDPDAVERFLEEKWRHILEMRRLEGRLLPPTLVVGETYPGVVVSAREGDVMVGLGPFRLRLDEAGLSLPVPTHHKGRWTTREARDVLSPGATLHFRVLEAPREGKPGLATLKGVPSAQGAAIVIEAGSGEVRAMVGGYDFRWSHFNRALQARRQPGSAFKPIVYAAALENGFHQLSLFDDKPTTFRIAGGRKWTPRNYGHRYYGPVTLRTALAKSLNTTAVNLISAVGVDRCVDMARGLGIDSPLTPSLPLALGASGVSLLELTRAYATIANQGRRIDPVFITRITDAEGHLLFMHPQTAGKRMNSYGKGRKDAREKTPGALEPGDPAGSEQPPVASTSLEKTAGSREREEGLSPANAYILIDMLKAVVETGTGRRVKELGRPVAGKTGTTNRYADAWFVGFTPRLVAGVWIGSDTLRPLGPGETGGTTAAPIWLDFMKEIVRGSEATDFPVPPGVVFVKADPKTGKPSARGPYLPFALDTLPEGFFPEDSGIDPADEL